MRLAHVDSSFAAPNGRPPPPPHVQVLRGESIVRPSAECLLRGARGFNFEIHQDGAATNRNLMECAWQRHAWANISIVHLEEQTEDRDLKSERKLATASPKCLKLDHTKMTLTSAERRETLELVERRAARPVAQDWPPPPPPTTRARAHYQCISFVYQSTACG